jgi:hypothetical protein
MSGRPLDQICTTMQMNPPFYSEIALFRLCVLAALPGRNDLVDAYPAVSPPANIRAHLRCAGSAPLIRDINSYLSTSFIGAAA